MKTTAPIAVRTEPASRRARWRTWLLAGAGLLATVVIGCDRSPTGPYGSCPTPNLSFSPAGTIGATVDGLVASEMRENRLPGLAIALAKQGKIIYAQGYGYADLGDCQPAQSMTPFMIGSVTKTFTAAAILQLQSTDAVDIDTSVVTYLPKYPFDPRLTVRDLLNQVSGLPDYINNDTLFPEKATASVTEDSILTLIARAPLQFTPGSQYQYSNSNYFVLGSIIEVTSSESYTDYLATKIIGPLALTLTSLVQQPPAAALPYDSIGQQVRSFPFGPMILFAAGGVWSNVLDLARFDAALFRGRVVPAKQFAEMVTPTNTSQGYGMGLWLNSVISVTGNARPLVWHSGKVSSYNAFNGFFLDDGWSISLLTNADPETAFTDFAQEVIQAVCPSPPSSSPTAC